jgi:SAM-dependent methyltransferase
MRWFRPAGAPRTVPARPGTSASRTTRRSIGLGELLRSLSPGTDQKLCILDLGPTSPANINFLTDREMRVFNEDIMRAVRQPEYMVHAEDGSEQFNSDLFFAENLAYPENQFDAILCWDAPDYLPESLVKPLVGRIHTMLKPGGVLLAFFHTRDTGPESPYYRYDITQPDTLELESRANSRLQRIFNNRHIENLFKDFASKRFFLGRDNLREVIVVR